MDLNPSAPGELHEFTFDLETQGLRTRSYTKKYFRGRSAEEPIQVSSIAYGRMGKTASVNAYTDIITPELLHKHRVTEDMLNSGGLPDSLLDEIVRDPNHHYAPYMAPRWDPALRTKGSVLDGVFRRHAKHVLKGEGVLAQKDVYQQLVNEWSGIATAGGKVSLGAWNVGYDMPTLFREMRRHGFSNELDNLLKSNSIRVREMAESVHAMRFQSMLETNWTPVMTDRSVIQAAVDRGLTAIGPQEVKNLGAVVEHTSLRQFMDDVKGGREAFKARASKWVSAQRAGSAQAQAVAEDLINRLSNVTDWDSFKQFVEYGHNNAHSVIFGEKTFSDVIGEMYGGGLGHAHILGDTRTLNSTMRYAPMAGKFSAFSFVAGGRLQDVSGVLTKHAKELGVAEATANEITRLMTEAHSADADRRVMELTSIETNRIRKDRALFNKWIAIDQAAHREAAERRVGQLFEDISHVGPTRSAANALEGMLAGGGKAMKKAYGKVGQNHFLLAGLALAGAYVVGQHNYIAPPEQKEGIRRSEGENDTISGINTSDLPFSNISAFGSGYDQYYGMQQQAERVKIVRVLDGDTVQYWRGGKLITGRLAGVDTPETVSPKKMPSRLGYEASSCTKNLLTGQSVWVRQFNDPRHGGDSRDVYGREMVFVDFDGINVNSELVRRGYSDPKFMLPEPVIQGSEIYGYLKHRMANSMQGTLQWLDSLTSSDQRAPDPFMWTALGSVSAMTDEEEPEDDPEAREQPVGYGGRNAQKFRDTGYAGYVQQLDEDAIGHGIRDHATQLHRLPGLPRTLRGRRSHSAIGHAERAAMMGA